MPAILSISAILPVSIFIATNVSFLIFVVTFCKGCCCDWWKQNNKIYPICIWQTRQGCCWCLLNSIEEIEMDQSHKSNTPSSAYRGVVVAFLMVNLNYTTEVICVLSESCWADGISKRKTRKSRNLLIQHLNETRLCVSCLDSEYTSQHLAFFFLEGKKEKIELL